MSSLSLPQLMTAEEWAQLDEVIGFRDELIDGERVLSPTAIFAHSTLIEHLTNLLRSQLATLGSEPLQIAREAGWKFHNPRSKADSVPVPDIMVIRSEDARQAIQNRGWFEGIPVLVIEVVSPSERKSRRLQKVGLYLEMGVPHVVEVDYTHRVIRVHTPDADTVTVYRAGDRLDAPFQASVDEIFKILD